MSKTYPFLEWDELERLLDMINRFAVAVDYTWSEQSRKDYEWSQKFRRVLEKKNED